MTDPHAILWSLFREQGRRLNAWLTENPDADQSPDYQAELSRWQRLQTAIAAFDEGDPR